MPSWLIAVLAGLGGLLAGFALAALAVRARLRHAGAQEIDPLERLRNRTRRDPEEPVRERGSPLHLIRRALRDPLASLRRAEGCPPDTLAQLEHIGWQCRMLTSAARPMKAVPTPPVELLQRAAEGVDLLRLGKVSASWTLRDRQPIHADAERAGAAFRELLTAAASLEGEGGRLAIRVVPTHDGRHPVAVEIETARRTGELDPLALRVGRHLLEGQGARVEQADLVLRVLLPHLPPEEELEESKPQTDAQRSSGQSASQSPGPSQVRGFGPLARRASAAMADATARERNAASGLKTRAWRREGD